MKFVVPRETYPGETRVPIIPANVSKLVKKGIEIHVESGIGTKIGFTDEDYTAAGAQVSNDRWGLLAEADVVLRLRPPPVKEVEMLKKGCIQISNLDPFEEKDLLKALVDQGVTAFSMELMPRTTLAQKMDVLSSQASLAGYVAVIMAAEKLNKAFPMMMTPAGTLTPARVFIVGAGVAGLQAIATARRLGARVEAFDVRPEAAEQIESLGAKAVKIDIGETGSTGDGYAKALTPEQLDKQRQGMVKICSHADVIITTAQVFGGKAPVIITEEMIKAMSPGSIIIDMAVESGGNVAGSKIDEEVTIHGIQVYGWSNLAGRVPFHASQMYSANICNMVEEFWDEEAKTFKVDLEDEIIAGCLVTHDGAIVNEKLK